ncbi:MAG: hypothetical protein V7638_3840 [Acidobacteriota bacterium]|jgi:hypothetical protein
MNIIHYPADSERIIQSLRRLIEKAEAGEIVVECFSQDAHIEEVEPEDGTKRFRNTGCYTGVIIYRRNGPARPPTVN